MITVQTACEAGKLEEAVDKDIADFDMYFQNTLKNEPLTKSERAAIKTYLWFKTHVNGGSNGTEASPGGEVLEVREDGVQGGGT